MAARSKARKRAVDILYEAELRGDGIRDTLAARVALADPPVPEYAMTLVEGVADRRTELDTLLATHAVGWTLDRMPLVDKNILRVGAYELLYADDIPDGVAISEAVRLASELAGDESPAFVNGLLGRIREVAPSASAEE